MMKRHDHRTFDVLFNLQRLWPHRRYVVVLRRACIYGMLLVPLHLQTSHLLLLLLFSSSSSPNSARCLFKEEVGRLFRFVRWYADCLDCCFES
jgi:hypothetical protein